MSEEKIWEQQCEAALDIRDRFGWWKAAGYLVGEKFLNALRARQQFGEDEIKAFASRVRKTIPRNELESYFKNADKVGALAHVMSDDDYQSAGRQMTEELSPAGAAEDILLMEQARALILS